MAVRVTSCPEQILVDPDAVIEAEGLLLTVMLVAADVAEQPLALVTLTE